MKISYIGDQAIASVVDRINSIRIEDYRNVVEQIITTENNQLTKQSENLLNAFSKMEQVRRFADADNLNHVLGSMRTKHGEIAERLEVGVRNAWQALNGFGDIASIDNVGRTAPADYIINGVNVQSKFTNGELNTLKHVFEHLQKYEDIGFARGDGSYYHIPKDQFENIMKALNDGEIPGRRLASSEAILRAIKKIEDESGQKFTDIVKSANANYSDVQLGKINDTIDKFKDEFKKANDKIVDSIKEDSKQKIKDAVEQHKPNLGEAAKAGVTGAMVAGGLKLATKIYQKKKSGKNISEFTVSDWKEIGIDTAKGAAQGGITGVSIYGLTNYANMTAPVAGGLVSASFGVAKAFYAYKSGEISFDEFKESSEIICLETGFVALGSIVGQALIPIPYLGAVVGSIVSSALMDVMKGMFAEEKEMFREYFKQVQEERLRLGEEVKRYVDEVIRKYNEISKHIQNVFNEDLQALVRFEDSQKLALACGVQVDDVLFSVDDIDDFFLK